MAAMPPLHRVLGALLAALSCAGLLAAGPAGARPIARALSATPPIAAATLTECVDALSAGERYATFGAEMTALPASTRMEIRIEVQEQLPGQAAFHTVLAPGLGTWRPSDASVGIYKYLRQVTNLAAPAVYRASVRFRWLNARGSVVRRAERLTPRCAEPSLIGSGGREGAGSPAG